MNFAPANGLVRSCFQEVPRTPKGALHHESLTVELERLYERAGGPVRVDPENDTHMPHRFGHKRR